MGMAASVTVLRAWRRGGLESLEFGWLRAAPFEGEKGESEVLV